MGVVSGVDARVLALADGHAKAAVDFLLELVRAVEHGEDRVQDLVAKRLAAAGCTIENQRYNPKTVVLKDEFADAQVVADGDRVNVIGRLAGTGGGRSLILFAHPDGEPIQRLETWSKPPFKGVQENGRLYGWGVADDLAGVASGVIAIELLVKAGLKPKGEVLMASSPSKRHARGVVALLQHGYNADGAVYLHPAESGAGMRDIKAFCSGQAEFHIAIDGQLPDTNEPNHTVFYHRSVNPIDKAMVIHRALVELGEARAKRVHHPLLEAAVGRSTNIQVSRIRCGEMSRYARLQPNCEMGGAVSFPAGERPEAVRAEIEAAVAAAAKADPWLRDHPPRLKWLSSIIGAEVSLDHPLYKIVESAVIACTGTEPHVNALHTISDIRNPIIQKGIPTVAFGCKSGDLTQAGQVNEWIDVDDYVRMIKVTAATIAGWCGLDASRT